MNSKLRIRSVLALLGSLCCSASATAGDLVYFREAGVNQAPRELYDLDPLTGVATLRVTLPGPQRFFSLTVEPATGTVYGIEPVASGLYTLDINTGVATLVASTGLSVIADITFDPATGLMYGLGRNTNNLYQIDHTTGASTFIGNTGAVRTGLVFSPSGVLYGFTLTGALYTVDKTNASVTLIGGGCCGLLEDATFTAAGKLYTTDFDGQTFEVDPLTGMSTFVADTGLGNGLLGIMENVSCGTLASYCTAGTTTNGCTPSMSGSGTPSASAGSGFTITCNGVEGQKQGIVFYGLSGQQALPWGVGGTSLLCVKAPTQRMNAQSSGGTIGACDGTLSTDWNAFVAANPSALGNPFSSGDTVDAQAWFRDPPAPKTTNLSNALHFALCP